MYNVTLRYVHRTTVAIEKQWVLRISVCAHARTRMHVALLIQHAKHMSCIMFSCDLSGFTTYFKIISNSTIFGKKLLNMKCVFWLSLQLLSETFPIVRRIMRDIVINVKSLHIKYQLLLSDFKTCIFLTDFLKNFNIKFNQYPSSGIQLFHANGWTDIAKLIVAFHNFADAPIKG